MSNFSTERYDGKTRKDDIRKYTIIAIIVAAAVIACGIGIFLFHRATAPDYTFIDANYGDIPEETLENIENVIGEVVGDKNNNGKVKVNAKVVMPATFGGYSLMLEPMFTGDYILFLISDPSQFEDMFIETIDISSSPLLAECCGTYACILDTDDRDVEEAEQIVAALLTAEPGTSE